MKTKEEVELARQEYEKELSLLKSRTREIREDLHLMDRSGRMARIEMISTIISVLGEEADIGTVGKGVVADLLNGKSYEEIAASLGVTRERVRQIFQNSIREIEGLPSYRKIREENERLVLENDALREALANLRIPERYYDEMDDTFDILMQPIDALGLSARSYNCLYYAKIQTVADVVRLKESELRFFRNLGRKCHEEIRSKVEGLGLHFGYDVDGVIAKHFMR